MTQRKSQVFFILLSLLLFCAPAVFAELENGMQPDVVLGQPDFNSSTVNNGGRNANTFFNPKGVFIYKEKMIVAESGNNRVLIFNSVPTTNRVSADVVIGQADFRSGNTNQGGACDANTLSGPTSVVVVDGKLFISDYTNARILVFNSIPITNNARADLVIGQPNLTSCTANQGGAAQANTFASMLGLSTDGKKLFVTDEANARVLIYNKIPNTNNASADVVIGQPDFTSSSTNQGGSASANTLSNPKGIHFDGKKLFIWDRGNQRVLIYNKVPTANNAPADVVIGQPDFSSVSDNQGGAAQLNTLNGGAELVNGVFSDGQRLFIADYANHRVLIFNQIPTKNNESADIVIGDGTAGVSRSRLNLPASIFSDGKRLFVSDKENHRILIYNLSDESGIKLSPQFTQGKAVLGKVFSDLNENGTQDEGETGLEGVKVISDTGIYSITDKDGKYHMPYIETGQHILKIDPMTLPKDSYLTTPSPIKINVTKGILTKVSFGVHVSESTTRHPERSEGSPHDEILRLKAQNDGVVVTHSPMNISISQDPLLLKPTLKITHQKNQDKLIFTIDCNYFLFIKRSELTIYNKDHHKLNTISLPNPIPRTYKIPLTDLPTNQTLYYQLSVYDKDNREDRTGVGEIKPT